MVRLFSKYKITMKSFLKIISICLVTLFISCEEESLNLDPNQYLSLEEQEAFKYSIIRYYDKRPKKVKEDDKLNSEHDSIYKVKAQKSDLLFLYFDDKTKEYYFAVTRIAPSMKLKKVATVGRLKKDANDSIVYYEENFRTWKMEMNELKEKTSFLMTKFIKGENLKPYYTKNSQPEFWIEFPDDNNVYDIEKREWKTSLDEIFSR